MLNFGDCSHTNNQLKQSAQPKANSAQMRQQHGATSQGQTKPRWGSHASKTGGDGTQDSILDARRPKRGVRKGEFDWFSDGLNKKNTHG